MATQQGWDDFCLLKEFWRGAYSSIESLKTQLDELAVLKATLLDDSSRLSAMRTLGNEYPGTNMNAIVTDVSRLIALKAILTANGY